YHYLSASRTPVALRSYPTRRSSDLPNLEFATIFVGVIPVAFFGGGFWPTALALVLGTGLGSLTHGILSSWGPKFGVPQLVQARRSEEHTSELQSLAYLVCRLLLEKK